MYWYELLKRPMSLGTQPKGVVEFDEEKGEWGIIAYDRELSDEELSGYELGKWNK